MEILEHEARHAGAARRPARPRTSVARSVVPQRTDHRCTALNAAQQVGQGRLAGPRRSGQRHRRSPARNGEVVDRYDRRQARLVGVAKSHHMQWCRARIHVGLAGRTLSLLAPSRAPPAAQASRGRRADRRYELPAAALVSRREPLATGRCRPAPKPRRCRGDDLARGPGRGARHCRVGPGPRLARRAARRRRPKFKLIVGAPGSETQLVLSARSIFSRPRSASCRRRSWPSSSGRATAKLVSPIGFGDSWRGHPVVGVTPAFVRHLAGGAIGRGRSVRARSTRWWSASDVPLALGASLHPTHGMVESPQAQGHDFTLSGRRAAAATRQSLGPRDRGADRGDLVDPFAAGRPRRGRGQALP